MAEKIKIAELEIDAKSLIDSAKEIKKEISDVKAQQDLLKRSGQENSAQFVENTAVLKTLTSQYNAQVNALAESGQATQQQVDKEQLLTLALEQEVQTIEQAREQNKVLTKLRNETNASTEEGQRAIAELNAKLDENNQFIRVNVSGLEQQKMNVGNYAEGVLQAFSRTDIFGDSLGQVNGLLAQSKSALDLSINAFKDFGSELSGVVSRIQNLNAGLQGMTAAQKVSAVATNATSGALKLFRIALISTGIGAIVVALGSLIAFLTSTQKGIDLVTSVTRPLTAVFESLFGVVQELGEGLFNAFSNPKKAIKDLANLIKQNLINRFKAFGVILDAIINRDFDKLKDGLLQAGTGVENLTEKTKQAGKNAQKFFNDAIQKGRDLDKLEKELIQTRIKNTTEVSRLNQLFKEQNLIAEDQNKSLSEREKASARSIEIAKQINSLKQRELDIEIAILKNKQIRNDTSNEELLQLAELEAKKNELNAQEIKRETTQNNKLNTIRKQAIDQEKKRREDAAAKRIEQANKVIDAEIEKQNQALRKFIANQGIRKKETEEELKFNQDVYDKELKQLEFLFSKQRISKQQFEADKLELSNDFALKQRDLLIDAGQQEIEIIRQNQNLSIDERLASELKFQELRLQQGVINETEYQTAIKQIEDDFKAQKEEQRLFEIEREKERQAIDLENRRANNQITFEEDIEIQRQQNEIKKQEELAQAETTGADIKLINEKYASLDEKLTQSVQIFKQNAYKETFSAIAGLFGEQTALGKAAAIAEVGITTFQKAFDAFALAKTYFANPITVPLGVNAAVQGGLITTQGAITAGKIAGVKFAKGGLVNIEGKSHAQGGVPIYAGNQYIGEAEGNEGIGILNRKAWSSFLNFNNEFGKSSVNGGFFQQGGLITQTVREPQIDLTEISNAIANIPAPIVAVEEIQSVGQRYTQVVSNADL